MQKFTAFRTAAIITGFVLLSFISADKLFSQEESTAKGDTVLIPPAPDPAYASFKNAADNEKCFQCHGQSTYQFINKSTGKIIRSKMYSELIINRSQFYSATHGNFKCYDCHSEDYTTWPHPNELRMEAMPLCIDCHGGDEQYAKYNFEGIEKEFLASVHSVRHSENFTCWSCHNPHTYKVMARTDTSVSKTIAFDNAICLNCHGNISNYQILTDKQNPNIIRKHEWLPNQTLHFASVRCIECHTIKINDSTLVAHNINPKNKAIRTCDKCHSTNSELMAQLYKYKVKETRSAKGFLNGVLQNEEYVIGANRNFYLNVISVIIFGIALIGIVIHAILRILK